MCEIYFKKSDKNHSNLLISLLVGPYCSQLAQTLIDKFLNYSNSKQSILTCKVFLVSLYNGAPLSMVPISLPSFKGEVQI